MRSIHGDLKNQKVWLLLDWGTLALELAFILIAENKWCCSVPKELVSRFHNINAYTIYMLIELIVIWISTEMYPSLTYFCQFFVNDFYFERLNLFYCQLFSVSTQVVLSLIVFLPISWPNCIFKFTMFNLFCDNCGAEMRVILHNGFKHGNICSTELSTTVL